MPMLGQRCIESAVDRRELVSVEVNETTESTERKNKQKGYINPIYIYVGGRGGGGGIHLHS